MENSLTELIENYKLSLEEHKDVLELLKKKLFSTETVDKNPSVMFVIGQPGCGKTTFINNYDFSRYININSDEYRHLNKFSKEILEKYPTDYAKLTNYDAHLWGDELFSYAVKNGYSVLREKAPLDYSLIEVIKSIPSNYEIVINLVVTGNLQSLLATRERYEKEILEKNNAKLSNIEAHNKCYELLPSFISKCILLGVKVNYIVYNDNKYNNISVNADYLTFLQDLRKESNIHTCSNYDERIDHIKENMIKRKASQEQFDELKKLEKIYYEIINKLQ